MSQFTRRRFLGSPAALPIGLGLAAGTCGRKEAAAGPASMIVTGARVLTMNSDEPTAEAVAILGDRILAIGSNDDIRSFADGSTNKIDGRGMTVTPGFIDSHSHPLLSNEALGINVNFRRIEDVKKALAGKAAQTPPGGWVLGVLYDDTTFEMNGRSIEGTSTRSSRITPCLSLTAVVIRRWSTRRRLN